MSRQVIIITGSTRGIGLHCLRKIALHRRNMDLVMTGSNGDILRREAEALQSDQRFTDNGNRLLTVQADLSGKSQPTAHACQDLIQRAVSTFQESRIASVVFNAGVLAPIVRLGDMEQQHYQLLQDMFQINVLAPFYLTDAVLKLRKTQGERVSDRLRLVYVSSGLGTTTCMAALAPYSATKASINQLMKTAAIENPDSCTTVAMSPGPVDTDMQGVMRQMGDGVMSVKDHEGFVNMHNTQQLVTVDQAATFLASLALHTPHEWTGEFVNIREQRAKTLVQLFEDQQQQQQQE